MSFVSDRKVMFEFIDHEPNNDPHTFINMGVVSETKINKTDINSIDLKDNEMLNPFFVGIEGSNMLSLTPKDIYQSYSNIYIMCMKDNISCNTDTDLSLLMKIFNKIITVDDFKTVCNMFILIPAHKNILKNYNFKKKASIVDRNILSEYFNNPNYNFGIDEIVVPMYELSETKALLYSNLYNSSNMLHQLTDIVNMVSYYNNNYTLPVDNRLSNILSNIDNIVYWKNPKNSNFNMNSIFTKRTLSYNGVRLDKIRYNTIRGANTLNNMLAKLDKNTNDNYIDEMKTDKNDIKSEHVNIYQVLKTSDSRTFYAANFDEKLCFTKDSIYQIFQTLYDEKHRFKLFNSLLVSKEYCHLVVNNINTLIHNHELIEKYKPLYAYLFGYAWITLYLEESILSTKATKKHRFVFDIDTANKLPIFPFSMENIHHNPYVTLLLDRNLIDPATNAMSICSFHDKNEQYYGVCTKDEAIKRMNVFVTGNQDINIFNDLEANIFSVSGSIIPACIPKYNPLIDTCTNNTMTYNEKWDTYFRHFYGNSDIDVMCGTNSMTRFIKYVSDFINKISANINCIPDDIKITPFKKMTVLVTKHFFTECLDDINEETGTEYTSNTLIKLFESFNNNKDNKENDNKNVIPQDIIRYFYVDYVREKSTLVKKWKLNEAKLDIQFNKDIVNAYKEITPMNDINIKISNYAQVKSEMTLRDNEIYYFINDFRSDDTKVPNDENYLVMKFSESLKFKLSANKLKRTIEIFQSGMSDPFNTVARFHKPCVRAYYQDGNIYMLPSCITSMMTYINIDYKYFAGSRDPIEIINKYMMRGFSVILNSNEKKSMITYNKNIDTYNGMFKIDSTYSIFGPKKIDNKIFKPGKYMLGLSDNIYENKDNKDNKNYINTIDNLVNIYKIHYEYDLQNAPINIFNFTAIGKNGSIKPLQTWVIDAFYESINQKN